jgi:hypothetical protein
MKVQFNLPVSSKSGSFHTGEVADVSDLVGRQWVKAGYCNEASELTEQVEAPAVAPMRHNRRTKIAS